MITDTYVQRSQLWVNAAYRDVAGFVPAPTDGRTGWRTMFAFTRALQHELGISALSDTFGPTTMSTVAARFPSLGSGSGTSNIRALVQCAMWCKGYQGFAYTGGDFGTWDATTTNQIAQLLVDLGLPAAATIGPKVLKSLFTMDAYVLVSGGSTLIRSIQRDLNARYSGRRDYAIVPCDGVYSRDVQRGFVYGLQFALGMDDDTAIGEVGPMTLSRLASSADLGPGRSDGTTSFLVHLFQAALAFNGYASGGYDGIFSENVAASVRSFQAFAALPQTGRADPTTWASLLISTGDTRRPTTGFDCSSEVTPALAAALRADGYDVALRYLNGSTTKRVGSVELGVLWHAGFRCVLIWQENNDSAAEFSKEKGREQGRRMLARLKGMGVKENSLAYLAVDFDATADDIASVVIPHFEGVAAAVAESPWKYRIGVYGTRNVGARLAAAGLSASTWVSGMSTGYSGNLGYPLPGNWAFDQIQNVAGRSAGGKYDIEIDRDVVRPGAESLGAADVARVPRNVLTSGWDDEFFWRMAGLQFAAGAASAGSPISQRALAEIVLTYLQKPEYWGPSKVGYVWQTIIAPLYSGAATREAPQKNAFSQTSFDRLAGTEVFPKPSVLDPRLGDVSHWAASTRAHLLAGVPGRAETPTAGDFASWGFDLVQAWRDYEEARVAGKGAAHDSAGKALTLTEFITWDIVGRSSFLTPADAGRFSRDDLRADMAAYLTASRLAEDKDLPLIDVVRTMLLAIEDDPGWLAKQFFERRFGSKAVLSSAVRHVFLEGPPVGWARGYFLGPHRRPGVPATEYPSSFGSEAAELPGIVDGFHAALAEAKAWPLTW